MPSYLIRDDGAVIIEATELTRRLPNFKPYHQPELPKVVEETVTETAPDAGVDYSHDDAEFDVEWASRDACIAYAKQNFDVDLSKIKSLAKLRDKVKELLNGNFSTDSGEQSSGNSA